MRRVVSANHLRPQVSNSRPKTLRYTGTASKVTARQRGCFLSKYQTTPTCSSKASDRALNGVALQIITVMPRKEEEHPSQYTAAVTATETGAASSADTGLQAVAWQMPDHGLLKCMYLSPSSRVPPILIFGRAKK